MKTAFLCMVTVLMFCVAGTPVLAQSWDFTLEPSEGETTVSLGSGDVIETGLATWSGNFTLVGKIRALSVDAAQPVLSVNFSNGASFTVGQGPATASDSAGFIFDLNGVGGSSVQTWGLNEENIFRITVERSAVVVDGAAQQAIAITGYHDGNQVYSGVAVAEDFGTLASLSVDSPDPASSFALSWALASFSASWAPLEGPATLNELPAGGFTSSDSLGWDFTYNGDLLPETLVANGEEGWTPREGETEGHPEYSTIVSSMDAQTGGLWSRLDDNSPGSGSQGWANGWLFGTNVYDEWSGRMTLVVRIRDLGTDSEKSVIDFTTADGANYWTLGHVAASGDGPAGWEFGQTNDGRNGNGTSDVRTGGFGEFVTIRIVIVDDTPGDGASQVWGWQDGELVYQSSRTDDISAGEFGEIAFRRTSGGGSQLMEIDWIGLKFGNAWVPGDGAPSVSGLGDGDGNDFDTPSSDPGSLVGDYLNDDIDSLEDDLINGVIGLDNFGLVKTVADSSLTGGFNKIFETDRNGMPVNLSIFYLGFDAMRDVETVPNSESDLTGLILLDRFGGLHNFEVQGPGELASGPGIAVSQPTLNTVGPGIAVSAPLNGPRFDYITDILAYNSSNPVSDQVGLPYFLTDAPEVPGLFSDSAIARDIELAVDWRQATNAFNGYYMMDAFGGVHYVNNAGLLDLVQNATAPTEVSSDNLGGVANFSTTGIDSFFNVLGFKPIYLEDYAGTDNPGIKKRAPYFFGFPIARDLEVSVRFETMTTPVINDSAARSSLATSLGVDVSSLYQAIEIPAERNDPSFTTYTPQVAITNGYVIMDGYGGMHSMIEDADGNPIPAPWEDSATGIASREANAPYFLPFDLAVDFELYPNGQGYALLTRTGQVFTVNANGTTRADHFAVADFDDDVPFFGFDAARDLTLVSGDDGTIIGMYILDRFGTTYAIGDVPPLPSDSLFLPTGNLSVWEAKDLELSPFSMPVNPAGN